MVLFNNKNLKGNFSTAHLNGEHASEFICPLCFSAEATWTKDNTNITGVANYTVKVEGERHSLLIKSAKISDGGKYCVTAVNQVGKASSSATLTVKGGKSYLWIIISNFSG